MIYRDCRLTSDSLSGRMANTPAISLCSQIAQAGRVGGWKRDGDDGGRRGDARHRAVRNGRDRNEIRQGVTGGKSCILRASSACFAAAKERAQRLAQPRRNSSSTGQWRKRWPDARVVDALSPTNYCTAGAGVGACLARCGAAAVANAATAVVKSQVITH
jgi:hypothetical protein